MMDLLMSLGNYVHLITVVLLLIKIVYTGTCWGLSGQTQVLLALVYTTRYLDVFYLFTSLQTTILEIIYPILGYTTIFSIYCLFPQTFVRKYDNFRSEILLTCCLAIALFINYSFEPLEVLWAFSVYLEAVAILPQLHFIDEAGRVEKYVFFYIVALAIYKTLYVVERIYRYSINGHYDKLSTAGSFVQLLIYCGFFTRAASYLRKPEGLGEEGVKGVDSEKGESMVEEEKGHLNYNISTIVLIPGSIIEKTSDKANLLEAEKEMLNTEAVGKN